RRPQVVDELDAGVVEPGEVQVPLVLVDGLAERDRRRDEPHLGAAGGERLGGVEPGPVAAPVAHDDAVANLRARERVPGVDDRDAVAADRGPVRDGAGREDDPVRPLGQYGGGRRLGAMADVGARSNTTTRCPRAAAAAAAAQPAGPAPTTTTVPGRAAGAGGGSVRS